jgi:hypothetical protein
VRYSTTRSEELIEQAMTTQAPLVVHSQTGAMPLRPDLYRPAIQIVTSEAESAETAQDASPAGFNWIALIGLLICLALARAGIWFLDEVSNRLLLALLAMGVFVFGGLGVGYVVAIVRSLFHTKKK